MMKKIISCILVIAVIMSFAVMASAATVDFTDIENSRYENAIKALNEMNIVEGYTKNKFFPNQSLTRAEAATIMVRALYGEEITRDVIDFTDVNVRDWFYEYVNTAVYYDIVHGMGHNTFAPDNEVTIDQMVTMVLNALGYNAPKLTGTWPENVQKIAKRLGLYYNLPKTIEGSDAVTRGQACQIIYNALDCYCVEYYRNLIVETDKTLYEAMGFKYNVIPSSPSTPEIDTDGVIVGPTASGFEPALAAGQYWGCVAFVETYTYGDENQYTGFEIVFAGDSTVYRFAGTSITYYFVQSDGTVKSETLDLYDKETGEIGIVRGDELWFEMTLPNSDVYKILSWNEPPYDPNNATRPGNGTMDPGFGVTP